MPKRTNEFQDLIDLLERQLAPVNAKVYSSRLYIDPVSGEEREVDIVIEDLSGVHPFVIGIEVIAHGRPASATWIETIWGRHQHLPINKSIAVSKSGFYKPAVKKARFLKIETLTLKEATELDWPSQIDRLPNVRVESFVLPEVTRATLVFNDTGNLRELEQFKDIASLMLFRPSGERRATVAETLDQTLYAPRTIEALKEKAFTDAGTVAEGEIDLEKGTYVEDSQSRRYLVSGIRFEARCRKEISTISLQKGRYADIAAALGAGETIGHQLQVSFSQRTGERTMVAVRVKGRNRKARPQTTQEEAKQKN